jgi:hypothetical protein
VPGLIGPIRISGGAGVRAMSECATTSERDTMSERDQENSMLDIAMLALGLGFFVAAVGYAYACERL